MCEEKRGGITDALDAAATKDVWEGLGVWVLRSWITLRKLRLKVLPRLLAAFAVEPNRQN
jgi:hypothetical protein